MAQMSSIALGLVGNYPDVIRACVINPISPISSDYEVRLHDGSIIRTNEMSVAGGQITIQEISGLKVTVDPSEIAQVRAGLTRVQPLISLPWKASEPSSALSATKAGSTDEQKAISSEATDNNSAIVSSKAGPKDLTNRSVTTWSGPNQEQILVVPANMAIEFPLKDKFRAVTMHLALAPNSLANAQATVLIRADGNEVGAAVTIKNGEPPEWVTLQVQQPKALTLRVSSSSPSVKLLIIDAVAVRGAPLISTILIPKSIPVNWTSAHQG
jgi:hypothetical protein